MKNFKVLYNKEIENIKNNGYLRETLDITDALIQNFANNIMKDEDKALMRMFFNPDVSQKHLDELLSQWDIEAKNCDKNLLLAYFMKYHPELKFNSYTKPRLMGLLNNIRFKNVKTFSHFVKIGKILNENNIIPIILKGGIMRILRPELPRIMGDIDILVEDKNFLKSVNLATKIGYTYDRIESHSIDLHDKDGKGALDVHKFIYMGGKNDKKIISGLFKRVTKQNTFGIDILVPSNEDLLFIVLNNLARNLRDNTSKAGTLFAIFDCHYLINSKKDFNWNIVIENAKLSGTQIYINFAIKFINYLTPYVLPDFLNEPLFEKETRDYSLCVMYKRFYLEEIREKSRKMKLKNLFKDYSLMDYLKLKPKYFLLKQLINHPFLIKTFIKDLKTKKYNF